MVNLFSYSALPTITPKSPEFPNLTKDNKSEIEPTPPEAITGISVISSMFFMNSSFVPSNVPSVFISVTIKLAILNEENSFTRSVAKILDCSSQPLVLTYPSFASIPTIILPGNLFDKSLTNSLFSIAEVPMITFSIP